MKKRTFREKLCKLFIVGLFSSFPCSNSVLGNDVDFCSGEWVQLHRACYKFQKDKATWDAAKTHCIRGGGYLVSVSSMAEKIKIKKHLQKVIDDPDHTEWWIGLRYSREVQKWTWEDGGEFSDRITEWAPGEPNNGHLNEDCTMMRFDGDLYSMGCDTGYPYICEKNKITLPPTSSTSSMMSITISPTVKLATQEKVIEQSSTSITSFTSEDFFAVPSPQTGGKSTETAPSMHTASPTSINSATTGKTKKVLESDTKAPMIEMKTNIYDVCYMRVPVHWEKSAPGKAASKAPSIRDVKVCPEAIALNINWPRTTVGVLARKPCRHGPGYAYWKCGTDPACWRGEPNIIECASLKFQELLTQTNSTNIEHVPTEEEALVAADTLVNITSGSHPLTTADIIAVTRVIDNVAKTKPKDSKIAEDLVKKALQTASNLLSGNQSEVWAEMGDSSRVFSASSIMESMESITMAMAEVFEEPASIVTKDENIAMDLRVLNVGTADAVYGDKDSGTVFTIPLTVLKKYNKGGLAKVVFMTHHKVGAFLGETGEQLDVSSESEKKPILASKVISASLSGAMAEIPEAVVFTMKLTTEMKKGYQSLCSFWEFYNGAAGRWSQRGCEVSGFNSTDVTCKCNHLTNFAVLLNVRPIQMSEIHAISLQYITIAGCIISIVCLVASWLTFQCFSALYGERNSIHKHLVFCLSVAEIVFLAGIDKTEDTIVCAVVASLLHYFFLAAFMWMFLEGIHIVMMLVKVFDASGSRMYCYYVIGYGVPLTIVGITASLRFDGYGTQEFCWISTANFLIWSFAGPVAFILLVNAVILSYAMATVCKHSEYVFKKEKGSGRTLKAWIQGALALEVLLGLTWVFGYFFISKETLSMAYIFAVLNSLQGFFIYVLHCLLNQKVRNEYKRCLKIKEKSKTSTTTGSIRKQSTSYEMYNSSKS